MTRLHGLAIAILSVWVGGTLFIWYAATRSFRTADRVSQSPPIEFRRALSGVSAENARQALRYLASEINRTYFQAYGWTQVVLGVFLLGVLWFDTPRDSITLTLVAGMVVLVLILTFAVMPQIVALGRSIDFLPRNPAPPAFERFWKFHGAFTALDSIKLLAGFAALVRLIAFWRS